MRRKLKNRVAAQTARDRKKARMDEVEITVSHLEEQNKRLQDENRALRQQTSALTLENQGLKERLGWPKEGIVKGVKSEVPESAVLFPLPQEQTLNLSPSTMHSAVFLMTFSLIFLTSLTSLMKQVKVTAPLLRSLQPTDDKSKPYALALEKWWGPQQKSWNPSKN